MHKIALAGVGRAFQHAELFPHMTVTENLLVGRHLHMRTGVFSGALYFGRGAARRGDRAARTIVEDIIDFFELYRYRDAPVGDAALWRAEDGRRGARAGDGARSSCYSTSRPPA